MTNDLIKYQDNYMLEQMIGHNGVHNNGRVLLHLDGNTNDVYGHSITSGPNVSYASSSAGFGQLLLANGPSKYIRFMLTGDLKLTGDFTIEQFVFGSGTYNSGYSFFIADGSTSLRYQLGVLSSPYPSYIYDFDNNLVMQPDNGNSAAANARTHQALTKQGNIWRLFLNGSLTASGTSNSYQKTDIGLYIGYCPTGSSGGYYIDEFRLTNGIALYTANFTPPNAPFTE